MKGRMYLTCAVVFGACVDRQRPPPNGFIERAQSIPPTTALPQECASDKTLAFTGT